MCKQVYVGKPHNQTPYVQPNSELLNNGFYISNKHQLYISNPSLKEALRPS